MRRLHLGLEDTDTGKNRLPCRFQHLDENRRNTRDYFEALGPLETGIPR